METPAATGLEDPAYRAAVVDLAGRTLAESAGRLNVADGAEPTLAWAASRFRTLLEETGRSTAEVCGVGVGLPCPIDRRTGRVERLDSTARIDQLLRVGDRVVIRSGEAVLVTY